MIAGIGVDMVDIRRMRAGVERFGERLAQRLLSQAELEEYRRSPDPAALLARRFAAKEALVKALGTGFRDGVQHGDISIVHTPRGQPQFDCCGRIVELMNNQGVYGTHISLSDERHYALAYVVLEKGPDNKAEGHVS